MRKRKKSHTQKNHKMNRRKEEENLRIQFVAKAKKKTKQNRIDM